MSMVIEVPADIEQALLAEARLRGVPVDSLIHDALAAIARPVLKRTAGDWDRELEALLDSLPELQVLPEGALTRETMYDDQD
jgi:hypothetical protein